jgi:hypothetical protein
MKLEDIMQPECKRDAVLHVQISTANKAFIEATCRDYSTNAGVFINKLLDKVRASNEQKPGNCSDRTDIEGLEEASLQLVGEDSANGQARYA